MGFLVNWLLIGLISYVFAMIGRAVQHYLKSDKHNIFQLIKGFLLCLILGPLTIPAILVIIFVFKDFRRQL